MTFVVLGATDDWSDTEPSTTKAIKEEAFKTIRGLEAQVPGFCGIPFSAPDDAPWSVMGGSAATRSASRPALPRVKNWRKVAVLLAALKHGLWTHLGCDVIGTIDSDALLVPTAPPLWEQEQVATFLADASKGIFVSREPPGAWARGSVMDSHGRNNLNNTRINTGLLLVKPGVPAVERFLQRWWCGPEGDAVGAGLQEPLALYRTSWPSDQRVFDELLLAAPPALSALVQIATHADDYNMPGGRFVRHFWWKPDIEDAAAVAAQVHRLLPTHHCATLKGLLASLPADAVANRGAPLAQADGVSSHRSLLERYVASLNVQGQALVVIGVHHFGDDSNDPLYAAVRTSPWHTAALIEASPIIARELQGVVERGPLFTTSGTRTSVSNIGICPRVAVESSAMAEANPLRWFYSFVETAGLPFWSTQIGSFSLKHIEKHFGMLLGGADPAFAWTTAKLNASIRSSLVACVPLENLLQSLPPARILLLDTEGLDCDIVRSTPWGLQAPPAEAGGARPDLLVFEQKHCSQAAIASARARLTAGGYVEQPALDHSRWPGENLFFVPLSMVNVIQKLRSMS